MQRSGEVCSGAMGELRGDLNFLTPLTQSENGLQLGRVLWGLPVIVPEKLLIFDKCTLVWCVAVTHYFLSCVGVFVVKPKGVKPVGRSNKSHDCPLLLSDSGTGLTRWRALELNRGKVGARATDERVPELPEQQPPSRKGPMHCQGCGKTQNSRTQRYAKPGNGNPTPTLQQL